MAGSRGYWFTDDTGQSPYPKATRNGDFEPPPRRTSGGSIPSKPGRKKHNGFYEMYWPIIVRDNFTCQVCSNTCFSGEPLKALRRYVLTTGERIRQLVGRGKGEIRVVVGYSRRDHYKFYQTYTCPYFTVHHMKGDTNDQSDSNLITVCLPCHDLLRVKKGKRKSLEDVKMLYRERYPRWEVNAADLLDFKLGDLLSPKEVYIPHIKELLGWVVCYMCSKASRRIDSIVNERGARACPFCKRDRFKITKDWSEVRLRHLEYPAIPQYGGEYPY